MRTRSVLRSTCWPLLAAAPSSVAAFAYSPTSFSRRSTSSLLRPRSAPARATGGLVRRRLPGSAVLSAGGTDNDTGDLPNGLNGVNGSVSAPPPTPQLYKYRWVQLFYLSILALISDWICFSVAATPDAFAASFSGHSAESLIDIFLFTNVFSCFFVTDLVAKFGLGTVIRFASVLMAVGCAFRSGTCLPTEVGFPQLVSYTSVVGGTIMVGAAQPFFQCTPPALSAQWFGSDERATSTAVALNFNQIGIATAFLVGGGMVGESSAGLADYFYLITTISILAAVGTVLQFKDGPPSPPSSSEVEKLLRNEKEPPFFESVKQFFSTKGFALPFAAFICSISITNVVGAFISEVMGRGGVTGQFEIDLAGAGFELAILVGGVVIGGYVDRTKKYKSVTLLCLAVTACALFPLGLNEHYVGKEPVFCVITLLVLGLACGPIQPVNAELAVDVTYPSDETAVESVQQIGGNLVSAVLVPVAGAASRLDWEVFPKITVLDSDIRGDVVLLMALAAATYAFYTGFDSPLLRTAADNAEGGGKVLEGEVVEVEATGAVASSTP
eukprot:CAMPEP_0194336786 /NCGR_PEP_ID=MMETSP0171-20130528/74178_1 /TAXON_ID=218684 /ORGANISM="Corethron pennatum, Strain L29A3" /LENGTH=555 /DNA_ID=CAMNT_0039100355 /DNA_START=225 /DNA_END=1892 /DNA_ORIENTATION=-